MVKRKPVVLDLYCGTGGMRLGFEMAGLKLMKQFGSGKGRNLLGMLWYIFSK